MMNVLALCLVLTSLVTGGVWSPTPENPNQNPNQIIKEGHRVVVVEYEKQGEDGTTTKVVISPTDDIKGGGAAKEKLTEAASATMDVVDDVKDKVKDAAAAAYRPRELVCDAFGKCKHKIATAFSKTKEKVSDTAHGVSEKVYEVEEHAKDSFVKAKDSVIDKTHVGFENAKEKTQEGVKIAKEKTQEGVEIAKEKTAAGVDKAKEKTQEGVEIAKEKTAAGVDKAKDVAGKLKNVVEKGEDKVKSINGEAKEAVREAAEKGKKGLNEVMNKGKEFGHDFISYALPLKRLDSVIDVVHLLAISMGYGMCVFVSFVSSYVLARTLTKQQFGMVQSKLYPVYHKALGVCVGVGLIGHLLGQRRRIFLNKLEMLQALNLLAALSTVLGNAVYLEPRATKLMFERMKLDKEEGKSQTDDLRGKVAVGFSDPVSKTSTIGVVETREEPPATHVVTRMTEQMKKLNMYSSFLNTLTLVFLSWHLVYLGLRLQLTR